MTRPSGRAADELRTIELHTGAARHAEGSCMVRFGHTRVLCTASLEGRVPVWMRGQGRGWVTAEYGMLPRSTDSRTVREASRGRQSGRTLEIQRLIGRSLRAVIDPARLGERQFIVDCDVIEADGGTRTAAITGAYVALRQAIDAVLPGQDARPVTGMVAAVSCGIVAGVAVLDLDYEEDSSAEADANFVMTDRGTIIEVQTTAERKAFTRDQFNQLFDLASDGIDHIVGLQRSALGTG
ncbi:MAG: ribonuclease PH [Alphaproteobacteria bacterium]|nr:ribonuclease PH [Alphaproteobacteria bacterium]